MPAGCTALPAAAELVCSRDMVPGLPHAVLFGCAAVQVSSGAHDQPHPTPNAFSLSGQLRTHLLHLLAGRAQRGSGRSSGSSAHAHCCLPSHNGRGKARGGGCTLHAAAGLASWHCHAERRCRWGCAGKALLLHTTAKHGCHGGVCCCPEGGCALLARLGADVRPQTTAAPRARARKGVGRILGCNTFGSIVLCDN